MKFSDLAREIIPEDVPFCIMPIKLLLENGSLPTASVWVEGKGQYKAGIVIPDIEVSDSINIIKRVIKNDPYGILIIQDILQEESIIAENDNMTPYEFAKYSIYHEMGHWYDFQNRYVSKGLDGKQFNLDNKLEISKLNLNEIGCRVRNERAGSEAQIALLRSYHKKYRENIFEIIADRFAINSMKMNKK